MLFIAEKFPFASTERLLLEFLLAAILITHNSSKRGAPMVRIKSSQKIFTEDEVTNLTGICLDHLRGLARNKHLGTLARAPEAASTGAVKWLFTHSDLMILTVLQRRCEH